MSMNRCKCERIYDTDWEMETYRDEMICNHCFDKLKEFTFKMTFNALDLADASDWLSTKFKLPKYEVNNYLKEV